jgi:predicted DNA-binding protein with PD1-like motif
MADHETINFQNPVELSGAELSSILSIDFIPKSQPTAAQPVQAAPVQAAPVQESEVPPAETTIAATEENVPSLGISESTADEGTISSSPLVEVINNLADKGLLVEAYEGFNENEDPNEDTLAKLIEHNFEIKVEEEITNFVGTLSPDVQRILKYDLDSKGEDMHSYLRALLEEQNIKALSIENEYDQERIVREWYRNKEGYTQNEVDEKIKELKDTGLLEKDAKRIKPKLDVEAEQIAAKKEQEQQMLRELERRVSDDYSNRVVNTLKIGKLKDIPLSREDAEQLYTLMTNDEIEVTTHTGKRVMMNPLEALIFYNKYDKNGSLENLALATLLLVNPSKFEDQYKKAVHTKESQEFYKEHKYSSSLKRGQETPPSKPKQSPVQNTRSGWRLKVK